MLGALDAEHRRATPRGVAALFFIAAAARLMLLALLSITAASCEASDFAAQSVPEQSAKRLAPSLLIPFSLY